MSGPAMFDANVLVYADDSKAGTKTSRAREVLSAVTGAGLAAVTPQVLGEYWNAATRKLAEPVTFADAESRIREYLNTMRLVPYDAIIVWEAMRATRRYGFHYYDAQIWAAARCSGVGVVLSEDFDSGSVIEGVRFVNPFADGFDLQALIDA